MALVRYGMCLDVLSRGGKAVGITKLLCELFALSPDHPIMSDGTTLKKTVERIYSDCRSQFGHGAKTALLEDTPFSRVDADILTAHVLESYVLCLSHYDGKDGYQDFLRAVSTLRQRIVP
jgi:hypothetical protein